jgi:homoserine kinase
VQGHLARGSRADTAQVPDAVWLFERFVGTDLRTMWRWLRTAEFDMSTEAARMILPEARTVRDWLVRMQEASR